MPKNEHILTRDEGKVRWLVFNRPEKHNALSLGMVEQALVSVAEYIADDSVRVLIVTGGGDRAFVSGADISEFSRHPGAEEKFLELCAQLFDTIYDCPKPTIAMINGYCFGGGVALVAACDLRYASDSSLYCIPAAKLGIAYSVTSAKRMVDLVGAAATREMLFTGQRYDSRQAEQMGLVNRVHPQSELIEQTTEIARTIASNAPISVQSSKFTVAYLLDRASDDGEEACNRLIRKCTASDDFIEGRAAHAEKRKPNFQGR